MNKAKGNTIISIMSLLAGLCIILLLVAITLSARRISTDDKTIDKPITFTVDRVIDGDTFVLTNGEVIRLYGVNTPEKGEDGYWPATHFTTNVLRDFSKVILDRKYKGPYGRTVAMVYPVTKEGAVFTLSLNELLVLTGNAVVVDRYCTESICDDWRRIQGELTND